MKEKHYYGDYNEYDPYHYNSYNANAPYRSRYHYRRPKIRIGRLIMGIVNFAISFLWMAARLLNLGMYLLKTSIKLMI